MVAVPAVIPVTTPAVTDALLLLLVHAPPLAASVSVIVAPSHTLLLPVTVPAFGAGLTVTMLVATAVPQLLVTV